MNRNRLLNRILAAATAAVLTGAAHAQPCPCDCAPPADGAVNILDFLSLLGQWGGPGSCDCSPPADGVVNVTDFLFLLGSWGPCPSSQPYLGGYSDSGCLPAGARAVDPCANDDSFELVVEGDRLVITHLDATYNCCPEEIKVTLAADDWTLVLTEEEILDIPCPCMCCYEVESAVEGLVPGEYVVEYWWHDYETGQDQCHTEVVVVPAGPA
jgi:hypothetical protein